jgi:uncharacterized protein (DUF1810 family)
MSQRNVSTSTFNLQRFIAAQAAVYPTVVKELRDGTKRSRWMWFVFPQLYGLGQSPMARQYAIRSRDEAIAYLATPLLGARLLECTGAVLTVPNKSVREIFGSPDDLKFHSSMTLFDAVDGRGPYSRALDRFFGGNRDQATLDILKQWEQNA